MQSLAAASALLLAVLPLPMHASVVDSTPQEGETLTEAVEELSVSMNEDILQVPGVETANVLYLQDADGNYYGDGCTMIDGRTASIAAQFGEAGEYRLNYTVVSADTHPVSGTINFTWEPPADHEPAQAWAEMPVCGEEGVPVESGATDDTAASETSESAEQTDAAGESSDAVDNATDDAQTPAEEEDGGVPAWVFIVISVAAAALIIGVIIGNFVRARRMRAGYGEPENDEADK